jgi:tetratricopeptide (TPR) repeat protein
VAGWTIDIGSGVLVSFNHALTAGYISAMQGNVHKAHQTLEELRRLEPRVSADFNQAGVAADDPRRLELEIEMQELKALILAREGNLASAIDLAQKAAEAESKLAFAFGPPDPIKPAAELLGELLLQAGQAQKADAAFRQALLRAPGRIQCTSQLASNER